MRAFPLHLPLRCVLTVLAALALLTPAQAARRVALLIGNSQYQHESSLANPVRDVELLNRTLQGLQFKTEVLKNLPKREMDLAIKRFVRESAGADTALLYYAGHGQQPSKGGRSYLLPVNANTVDDDALEADGILAEDIAAQLERLPNPARLRLLILDACRNTRAVSRSSVRGLAPPARTDSYTLIAYSTDANSVAQDGQGANSPYAQALAQNLARATQEPVRRVFEETAKAVRQATRQQQSPRTYGDLESGIGLDGVEIASLSSQPIARPSPVPAPPSQAAVQSTGSAAQAATATQPGRTEKDCAECPEMVTIPAGSFLMGSSAKEQKMAQQAGVNQELTGRENPQHRVTLRSFALSKYEVTQGQWKAIMGSSPSYFGFCGDACPVENVSWDDAQAYIAKLNQRTGMHYRLPSEAEWEYAARAGTTTAWSFGEQDSAADTFAWFVGNQRGSPRPVGQKQPNAFGLYDMHGNVREWVQDCWHSTYAGAPTNGSAWEQACASASRVLRGGAWNDYPSNLRSASRFRDTRTAHGRLAGLRLARSLP